MDVCQGKLGGLLAVLPLASFLPYYHPICCLGFSAFDGCRRETQQVQLVLRKRHLLVFSIITEFDGRRV